MSPSGEIFGFDRVDQYLSPDNLHLAESIHPKRVGERLVNEVRKHANGRAQNDDIAVVSFGRLKPGQGNGTGIARPATTPVKLPL